MPANHTMDRTSSLPQQVAVVDRRHILLGLTVGKGSFCEVAHVKGFSFRATAATTGHQFAQTDGASRDYVVKQVRSDLVQDTDDFRAAVSDLRSEAHFLGQIQHPHIIPLRGITTDGCSIILDRLMETLERRLTSWQSRLGRENHVLRRVRAGTEQRKRDFLHERLTHARNLASGLSCLHEMGIIHRDLKPGNMGFDAQDKIQIFDFGLSRQLAPRGGSSPTDPAYLCSMSGSLRYMAPEVATPEVAYDQASDVYSFSIVLWEMIVCQRPYRNAKSADDLQQRVFAQQERPCCKHKIWSAQPALYHLVTQGWHVNPSQRPTMKDMHLALAQLLTQGTTD
jgi:serine/threonine protein kinase